MPTGMGVAASNSFADLERQAVSDVPGVPGPLFTQTQHLAAAEFMRISRAWREDLAVGAFSSAGTFKFDLVSATAGVQARANPVIWVKIDGVEVPCGPYAWRVNQPALGTGNQQIEFLDPYDSLESGTITARVVWVPLFDVANEPAWVYAEFGGHFSTLTKGMLMKMPKKPWTNMELGMQLEREAKSAAMRVRSEMDRNDQRPVVL